MSNIFSSISYCLIYNFRKFQPGNWESFLNQPSSFLDFKKNEAEKFLMGKI